ncbi:MAG: protoporphyrinogen oxidase [Polyangiaceae bacterium]
MRHRAHQLAGARWGTAPSVFHSFPGGLPNSWKRSRRPQEGGARVETGVRVVRVERVERVEQAGYLVHIVGAGGPSALQADAVVLAIPGYAAADALRELDRDMASDLRNVPYVSSVVVGLAYSRADIAHRLDATGIITTDKHEQPIMAVTFLSSKWAGRAPEDGALFRVFMGGAGREETLAMSDPTLISIAERELGKLVGTRGAPRFARVYRHERASAQPVLGHAQRVSRVRAKESTYPGLFVVGAAMDGVGIPDCVRQATDLAKRVLAS